MPSRPQASPHPTRAQGNAFLIPDEVLGDSCCSAGFEPGVL